MSRQRRAWRRQWGRARRRSSRRGRRARRAELAGREQALALGGDRGAERAYRRRQQQGGEDEPRARARAALCRLSPRITLTLTLSFTRWPPASSPTVERITIGVLLFCAILVQVVFVFRSLQSVSIVTGDCCTPRCLIAALRREA